MSVIRAWFVYDGNGDTINPNNYIYTNRPPICYQGSEKICAILGKYNSTIHPDIFSQNLLLYIGNATASSFAQPSGSNIRKYVYTRYQDQ